MLKENFEKQFCMREEALSVAQVSNLPTFVAWEAAKGICSAKRGKGPEDRANGSARANRRLPVGRVWKKRESLEACGDCGLEIRDADWKSALRAGAETWQFLYQ